MGRPVGSLDMQQRKPRKAVGNTFSWALDWMVENGRARRVSWEVGAQIYLDHKRIVTNVPIRMEYTPNQGDILAEDWVRA